MKSAESLSQIAKKKKKVKIVIVCMKKFVMRLGHDSISNKTVKHRRKLWALCSLIGQYLDISKCEVKQRESKAKQR